MELNAGFIGASVFKGFIDNRGIAAKRLLMPKLSETAENETESSDTKW